MILRSPSVIMGFNNNSRSATDRSSFCGETTSSTFNTPKQQHVSTASLSTSSGPSKGVNPPIKSAQNNNNNNYKNNDNGVQDNNNTYLNFLLLQRQQQNQSNKRQQQQQQQQKEQQQGKSVLKVLPEEHRSIDDAKKDGGNGEEAGDYNCHQIKSQQQGQQEALVDSYDLQRGSSCRASTSTIPVPSANSGKKSKQQQQQLLNDKMVESRLYQQQQQKPAQRQNFGDADSVGGSSATTAAHDDAYDDFEKRAENRIIIKNGFKRTTVRVPPTSSDNAASSATVGGAVKKSNVMTINGAVVDNAEHKKTLLESTTKLQSNGMIVRLGASATTMSGRVSDVSGEPYNDESPLNRRWLLLMEPINALHIAVLLGAKGRIFRMDDPLATILGYESTNRLFGTEIGRLIPSLKIGAEWDGITQYCCGKTTRLNGVPLTAILQCDFDADCNAHSYDLRLRSISSINGVVTITDSGMLYSYNVNFLQELLGHQMFANEAEGKLDIKDLIPDFYMYQANSVKVASNSPMSELENEASGAQFALHFDDKDDGDDGVEEDAALEEDEANFFEPDASEEEVARQRQRRLGANHTKSTSDQALGHRESAPASSLYQKCGTSIACELQHSSLFGCSDTPSTSNGICISSLSASENVFSLNKKYQKLKRVNVSSSNASDVQEIVPGVYYGLIKHADSSLIPVKIEVSEVSMPSQPRMFNVGIGFDRSNDFGISQKLHGELSDSSLALDSDDSGVAARKNSADTPPVVSHMHKNKHPAYIATIASTSQLPNTTPVASAATDAPIGKSAAKFSIGAGFTTLRECDSDSNIDVLSPKNASDLEFSSETRIHDVSLHTLENENNDAVRGEYSKFYDTFQLIGNGAFGSVKLAARKNTGYLAVAKFVCKSKVLPESWVQSPKRGNRMVPIEVHLLENLYHANIVNVLDVFENDKYYQLVMEKLGSGMDLFEFIEFQPQLDEPLTSYIFRQIVSAVDYLHENHIVHRDLKDENVIVDHNFCCKLIDFGSAAYFGDNIVFSTFCGTMEYCSPEVLTGNKYLGPELEMWSLGILLYTLVFFENPFRNPQETVQAEFEIPWDITEGLYQVLNWLLLADPRRRATVGEIQRHWWVTQRVDPTKYNFQDVIKNFDHAQLMSPKYVSQLSAQNSAGSLSGLTISANGSGSITNPNTLPTDVCTSGAAAQQHNDNVDADDENATCNDEKQPSSTAASTVGTESSTTASPATSPKILESPLFTLNSIESDLTTVGSAPRDAATAH